MSAFVCILDRSGAAVDRRELERLAAPLTDYGPELATICRGPVGIAVRYRSGASPVFVGGASSDAAPAGGPVGGASSGLIAALAGRPTLTGVPSADASRPDLLARRLGEQPGLLTGAHGPFALVVAQPDRGWLSVVRDPLGQRKVYYALDGRRFIAASEPSALLRHPSVPDAVDDVSAVRFLAFRFAPGERSFFRAVRELPPAHRLHVTPTEERLEQYRHLRPGFPDGSDSSADDEIPATFLRLLRSAVAAETSGLEPQQIAVSLSGGLDSTAIAALAPRGVRAFSWYFDDTPEADERPQVQQVARHLGLPVHWVRGDGLHPLAGGFEERFVHRSSPYVNAFAALKCGLYDAARAAGCERVLVGDGGDALYGASEYWLRDAITERRAGALDGLAGTLRHAARGDRYARIALRRLLPLAHLERRLRWRRVPWLTAVARELLPPDGRTPVVPPGPRAPRHELIAGAKNIELESEEWRLFAGCGVDRGNPFWSWPLLEWVLGLPAHWYHFGDRTKVLTRTALRGRLPEPILEGRRIGLLGSFFLRGIEDRRADLRETVFRHPRSDWQRWVERAWLEPYLDATRSIGFGHTILWRVISYELWHRRLASRQ